MNGNGTLTRSFHQQQQHLSNADLQTGKQHLPQKPSPYGSVVYTGPRGHLDHQSPAPPTRSPYGSGNLTSVSQAYTPPPNMTPEVPNGSLSNRYAANSSAAGIGASNTNPRGSNPLTSFVLPAPPPPATSPPQNARQHIVRPMPVVSAQSPRSKPAAVVMGSKSRQPATVIFSGARGVPPLGSTSDTAYSSGRDTDNEIVSVMNDKFI